MTDPPGSPAFVARAAKHRCSLELQWQGRGGRFHHLAFRPRVLRRALGSFGIVVAIVVGALSLASSRAFAPDGIDAVQRENLELKARNDALREQACDLAEQLYWHAEQELQTAGPADAPGDPQTDMRPRPPGRGASDEAILAWLTEQSVRLEGPDGRLPNGPDEAGERETFTQAAARNRKYVQER